ncbi:vitamin K epoxide reductase family protein [Bowdeniella massiliensis]|uniref:vitamin K epoxide reductase family protein n=1 Tax=Bowdeniella massiliensis TaxID=2932264 RepID=UPI002028410A|nr:vitamin K epoxide reductase family protein [Bowdeniella massiliensis]
MTRTSRTPSVFGATQYGLVLLVCSLFGIWASVALLAAELAYLKNPLAAPACDLNTLIGCGVSLLSPQAHLVAGLPNALIGAMAFSVIALIALLQLSKVSFPRWLWGALVAGSIGALVFVAYFTYQSVAVFKALCPYCMVIWAAAIPIAVFTIGRAMALGHVPPRSVGTHLWTYRWLYTLAVIMAVVLVVVITMRTQIAAVI